MYTVQSWLRPLVQTPVTSSTQQAPSGHFLRPMSVASRQLAHRHMCTPGFLGSVCMHRLRWTADTAQIGISRSPGLYHPVGLRRKKKSDKKKRICSVSIDRRVCRDTKYCSSPRQIICVTQMHRSSRQEHLLCEVVLMFHGHGHVRSHHIPTVLISRALHTGRAHVCHVSVRDWSRGKGRVFATDELMSEKLRKRIVSKTN